MTTFLMTPWKMGIVLASVLIALTSLIILIKKKNLSNNKKLSLIYTHIFFLAFPVIFYAFYQGCQSFFSGCNKTTPIAVMLILTSIVALSLGTIVGQLLFLLKMKKNSMKFRDHFIVDFIKTYSSKLKIKNPKIYFVDSAKPFAFTYLKSRIFISIGLLELLDQKEIEAVLLHELSHLKDKSSVVKFSTWIMRHLSPIAAFSKFDMSKEEIKADQFAIKEQKTTQFLESAKKKIDGFYF